MLVAEPGSSAAAVSAMDYRAISSVPAKGDLVPSLLLNCLLLFPPSDLTVFSAGVAMAS